MPSPPLTNAHLLAQLHSVMCACTSAKKPMMTFCRPCYLALPVPMRTALYNRIGAGYGEAYAAAIEKLRELGRVPRGMSA